MQHARSGSSRTGEKGGFTLLEATVVLMIVSALIALGAPMLTAAAGSGDLRGAAIDLAGMLNRARSEAIRTGEAHIVFVGVDAGSTALTNVAGQPADVLLLNDGVMGSANQNCQITAGEGYLTLPPFPTGISLGVPATVPAAPQDQGTGIRTIGTTFTDPGGSWATWVLFRPDGVPLAFDSVCTLGAAGSGAGGFYFSDGERVFSVVLRPLGGARAHALDPATNTWVN